MQNKRDIVAGVAGVGDLVNGDFVPIVYHAQLCAGAGPNFVVAAEGGR